LTPENSIEIRPAEPGDVALIFTLIQDLAEYERAPDQVRGSRELLAEALFGEHPAAEALVAERAGEQLGFALFYVTFSTWECRPGLWLEDLFVAPEHRRSGVGRTLLAALAATALERGYTRLEWMALNWNEPALEFYEKLSATRLDEWVIHRLDGPRLAAAAGASAAPGAGHDPDD
jgi:GNAT superfamily N-acetyltransferase